MQRVIIALVLAAVALTACGEGEVASARYQGKPDTAPWDSPATGGDKANGTNNLT
jgi:hypothetical protein